MDDVMFDVAVVAAAINPDDILRRVGAILKRPIVLFARPIMHSWAIGGSLGGSELLELAFVPRQTATLLGREAADHVQMMDGHSAAAKDLKAIARFGFDLSGVAS
jgi:hypothetical protein